MLLLEPLNSERLDRDVIQKLMKSLFGFEPVEAIPDESKSFALKNDAGRDFDPGSGQNNRHRLMLDARPIAVHPLRKTAFLVLQSTPAGAGVISSNF